ncbi:hypothetical protein MRB53_041445 [Persea americana]|nr:hypothetical protein MRB53_041445 [Persea americana]
MEVCRFLRPALSNRTGSALRPAHARFFAAFRSLNVSPEPIDSTTKKDHLGDHARRVVLLEERQGLKNCYPRVAAKPTDSAIKQIPAFQVEKIAANLSNGRVQEVRSLSSKLLFLKCEHNGVAFQIARRLDPYVTMLASSQFQLIPPDATGHVYRTERGTPALLVTAVPTLAAPSLHQIPQELEDLEKRSRKPHIGMLVDQSMTQTLRIRSQIETSLIKWFDQNSFSKVSTPILSSQAGGATARPFTTVATELSGTDLYLRIAPELWLKRLVVGGMDRVYELGPAFRNEGLRRFHGVIVPD